MKKLIYLGIISIACIGVFSTRLSAQQTYYYDFRNTLNEKNSLGPALNVLGTGAYLDENLPNLSCLSRAVYSFTQGSGVQFDNGAAGNFLGTSYSIEMYFRFTSNTGFMRIIDFKNRTSDFGLYATSAEIQFYDEVTVNTTAFSTNEYVHLVLTRDGASEEVNIYLNGSFIAGFTDSNGEALTDGSNVINFFQDDLVFGGEAQPGNIALLKFYDFELDAAGIADNFQNLETASGVVAFSSDLQSACLSTNLFTFTNESENTIGVTYSWEFGDGNTDTGLNTSHSYTSDGAYTVLLIADDGLGCTDSASVNVTVTLTPTITPSGPVDLCVGESVTLTSSAGVSYLWSTGETTQSILVSTAGNYSVTVDDGLGCIETSDIITVTKYAAIPGAINYFVGSTVACPGQSLPYEINAVNRAVYYIWTMPAGATTNGQTVYQTTSNSIIVDFDAGFLVSGVIHVEAHNGCGVRGPSSKTVTNNPPLTPSPITGSSIACAGNTYPFSVVLRAGIDTYTWGAPPGSVITGQGSNEVDITFPLGFTVGYVTVIAQNSCGSSNQRSLYVRSNPPNPGIISGPVSALCNSIQTYSVPPSPYVDTFNWLAPAGSTVISGQGTPTVEISFNPGLNTGFVRVSATNSCGTSAIKRLAVKGGVEISNHPADAGVCSGDPVSFSVAAPGAGLIFKWRKDGVDLIDNGIITGSTTGTLSIDPVSVSDGGLYDCIVSRSCGTADTSLAATLLVDGGPLQPGTISGALVACEGDAGFVYSFVPVVGATSYNWSNNDGVTITSGQGTNSITVDFGPTINSGYELYVTALNGCGESDTTQLWIRSKVSTPTFLVAPSSACAGTSVVYVVNAVNGADSYNWTAPANATVSSGQGTTSATIDFDPSFTAGQVCVTASNICFTSPPRCRNVTSTPNFPGNIQGEGTNVCNSTQVYTINPVANATSYNWTIATGATITSGQGTNSVTIDFGPSFSSGNITVSTVNSCGTSSPRSRLIYGTPAKPVAIFGNPSPCANSSGNVYSLDPLPGATSYSWTVPIGAVITSGATTNSITVTFGATGGGIYASGNNDCGSGQSRGLNVSFSCRLTDEEKYPFSILVSPNPASELINLSIDQPVNSSGTIKITDLSGRIVVSSNFHTLNQDQPLQINISDLSSGVYIVVVNTDLGTSFARFIRD